jgi:Fatty acid hydroxylase
MLSEGLIRAATRAQGQRIKRNNLFAALLSGAILVVVSLRWFPVGPAGFFCGVFAGFIYANGFEYYLHRYLLHFGHGFFSLQHDLHHQTWQSPEGARYVNFSCTPWGVVGLFLVNGLPFLAIAWLFGNGWVAGAFVSFTFYYTAFEEIHWRTHMGGWLPGFVKPGARHHLMHHVDDHQRFNVFLPLFDALVQPPLPTRSRSHAGKHAR